LFRSTNIPAAIAAIVVALFGIFADRQDKQLFEERQRAEVSNQVSLIRTKLEGDINGNIQLVRGLVSVISTEPHMTQARFAELASGLLRAQPQIRVIGGAPDLVVSLMYPMQGNEKAIGLDYRKNAQQRAAAMRARDRREVILAGPVDLVQGGRGFIARFPVFTDGPGADETFWGIVSAVIDVDRLYSDTGLVGGDLPVDVAITGKDALGTGGVRFFGEQRVASDRPVTADVTLPSGSWQIAATPKGGWDARPLNGWILRLVILAAGLLVVIPTWLIGRLVGERRDHSAKLRDRESELERLSRRLELALDTSKVGVWEMNIKTGELVWDDRMNELYGYPLDKGVRTYAHWRDRLDPKDLERAAQDFETAMRTKGRYESQFRVNLGDGQTRVIRTIGSVYVASDSSSKILGVNWDVTADVALTEDLKRSKALTEARNAELESARARIEHNSLHDFLTKLPNRMYLERVLEEHAERCARSGAGIVLLHIDLDRFKQINDTLGHPAGDAMLVRTAEVIRANLRGGDFVARTGGDEFVIVCNADMDMEGFDKLARRLIEGARKPVMYEGHECRFGMSIGIAGAFGNAVDRQRLLVNADLALYRAKNLGRNRFEFYTEALHAQIVSAKQTADSIMSGLERGEFIPYFQPQFNARTFELVGVEALVRWRHPTRGIVAPMEFIPIAEELNVLGAIDRVVLEQGLAQFRRWQDLGLRVPRFSVNVSIRRLKDDGLVESLRDLNIPPGALSFELVESIYLDESDDGFSRTIDQIKELGIDIEIDDFGTGYASIVSLMKLKPRRLKIDQQLVIPIVRSETQRRLVQSIVDIGKSLDIEIVAEGVETMEHARMLRDLGCEILQGYVFAKPMAGDQVSCDVGAVMRSLSQGLSRSQSRPAPQSPPPIEHSLPSVQRRRHTRSGRWLPHSSPEAVCNDPRGGMK
jgi:diguanylate cyclase (GGDEF)-like protein